MRTTIFVLALFFLAGFLAGCQGDISAGFGKTFGADPVRKAEDPVCRFCGTELSKTGYCMNVTCQFASRKQSRLMDHEAKVAESVKKAYSKLRSHDDPAETLRAKGLSRGWGDAWLCQGCQSKRSTRWMLALKDGDKIYHGPFICCSVECEHRLGLRLRYSHRRNKLIPFRVMHEPRPFQDGAYACIVMTRSKQRRFLVQTFPVAVAESLLKESVWHPERGRDLALAPGGKGTLAIQSFKKASPLTKEEKQAYLEFLNRKPKEGELDCLSMLKLTVQEETQRLSDAKEEAKEEKEDS